MKIEGAKQVHYDSGPNMTPLVDIVMVILIFLMLAGSFEKDTHFLTSEATVQSKGGVGGVTPPPGFVPDEQLIVQVDPDPQYGFKVIAGDIRSAGDPRSLLAAFKRKREAYAAAGTPKEKIQVVLSPSGVIRYEHLAAVYEAALLADFVKVNFAKSH